MKSRKIVSVLGASALAFGTMLVPAMPVLAAGTTYDGATGKSVNIQQYLIMSSTSEVPNVTFDFSIAAKDGVAGTVGTQPIYAGNDASRVSGTPTIGQAKFTKGMTKYSSVQNLVSNGIQVSSDKKDPVTLADGQSYAKADVAVDFSGVTFKEPGVYRYQITAEANKAVVNDENATRVMDVYVTDDGSGTLSVAGYVLHKTDAAVGDSAGWDEVVYKNGYECNSCGAFFDTDDEALDHTLFDCVKDATYSRVRNYAVTIHHSGNDDGKSEGFVSTIASKSLKIATKVSGNQASRDEYFKTTVKLTGALPNTTYTVDLSNADATTKTNGVNTDAHTNPAEITTDESGNASVDYWLQNGQSVSISGLNLDTTYEVSEDEATMTTTGYTVDFEKSGDEDASTADFTISGKVTSDDNDEINVAFTNTKSGTIPTGVVMAVAPFAIATIFGGAGAATIVMKKRKSEDE